MTSPLDPNIDDELHSGDQLLWQLQATAEGLKAADEGRLIAHETLTKIWADKRASAVD